MKSNNLKTTFVQENDEESVGETCKLDPEAEYNLKQYILHVWRIFQRLKIKKSKLLTEILKRRKV